MLTLFGSIAVSAIMVSYWLEPRSKWFVLLFAGGSAATALYSGLVEAYPNYRHRGRMGSYSATAFRQQVPGDPGE